MMHINIVKLETSSNQLGLFWNNKNPRSMFLYFCSLKGCNFIIGQNVIVKEHQCKVCISDWTLWTKAFLSEF